MYNIIQNSSTCIFGPKLKKIMNRNIMNETLWIYGSLVLKYTLTGFHLKLSVVVGGGAFTMSIPRPDHQGRARGLKGAEGGVPLLSFVCTQ